MQLVGDGDGWVLTREGILWTSDGGTTWKDISPPGIFADASVDATSVDVFFLDRERGWVVSAKPGQDGYPNASTITAHRTSDGGKTWERSTLGGPALSESRPPTWEGDLQFVDEQTGWLSGSYGGMLRTLQLYRTTDGGRTWAEVASPVQTGFRFETRFISSQDGWVFAAVGQNPPLYVTHDGGETWLPQTLEVPFGCSTNGAEYYAPVFTSASDAVLRARWSCSDRAGTTFYVSNDGGDTWMLGSTRLDASYTIVAETGTWLDIRGSQVFESRDGGANWLEVQPAWIAAIAPREPSATQIVLASLDTSGSLEAWWLVTADNQRSYLLTTGDGGDTWGVISP